MNIYSIIYGAVITLILLASVIGSVIFADLYISGTVLSPQWAILFTIVGVTTIIFLLVEKKRNNLGITSASEKNGEINLTQNPIVLSILNILFYIGLSLLLVIVFTNEIRPVSYVIILALLAVTIAASSLLSISKKTIYHALFKVIALFSVSSLSIFKIFYWTGRDTWTHAAWNYQLVQEGGLFAGLGKELSTPLYHVAVAISEIIPGLDVRSATIIAVTVPLLIIFTLSVFIVAKQIIGSQYAVIATIIADFIGVVPYWSSLGQSTTYACMVFAIMLVPLFKILISENSSSSVKWWLLFLFFAMSIALTHLYSTFIVVLYLIGVLITYLIVDFKKSKMLTLSNGIIITLGVIITTGYAIVTNLSLMMPLFLSGFSELSSKLTDESSSTLTEGDIFTGGDTIDTLQNIDFIQFIQNCFMMADSNIWYNAIIGCIKYSLLLIPFVIACLFVARYCFKFDDNGFDRSLMYILLPALMIFILLAVTTFAYPPITSRQFYYLPIFQGLLLSMLIWFVCFGTKNNQKITINNYGIILLIIFLIVSLGTTSTIEENMGFFKEDRVSSGHSVSEVYGLQTIVGMLPDKSTAYTDYEMKFMMRYANGLSEESTSVNQNVLDRYKLNNEAYVIFKNTLIDEASTDYIQYGDGELKRKWFNYNIDNKFIIIMDDLTSKVYDNYELNMWRTV